MGETLVMLAVFALIFVLLIRFITCPCDRRDQ